MAHDEIPNSSQPLCISDFRTICRICLEKGKELQSIFQYNDSEKNEMDLSLKMKKISSIEIHPSDNLPDKICKRCVNLLLISHYFKLLSENSDAKLRSVLNIDVVTTGTIKVEVVDEWNGELKLENDVIQTDIEGEVTNNKHMIHNVHIDEKTGSIKIGECNVVVRSANDKVVNKPVENKIVIRKKCIIKDIHDKYNNFKTEKQSMEELGNVDDTRDVDDIFDSDHLSDLDEPQPKQKPLAVGMRILPLESENVVKKHEKQIKRTMNKIQMLKDKIRPLLDNGKTTEEEKNCDVSHNVIELEGGIKLNQKILPLKICDEKKFKSLIHAKIIRKKLSTDPFNAKASSKIVSQKILDEGAAKRGVTEGGKSFECMFCKISFEQHFLLTEHMVRQHKKKTPAYICSGCDVRFKSRLEVTTHELKCQKIEKSEYNCTECDAKFYTRRLYEEHKATHPDSLEPEAILMKCPDCEYTTFKRSLLKTHIKCKHLLAGNIYICETCGKRYTNHYSFVSHKFAHRIPPDLLKCKYCDYSTRHSNVLRIHERIHTKDYRFTCEQCGQRFFTSSAMQAHRKRHSGVRAFQCSMCEKNYVRKHELACHIESVHDKVRPFKCTLCSSAFYQRSKCLKHMRQVHKITSPDVPSLKVRKKIH